VLGTTNGTNTSGTDTSGTDGRLDVLAVLIVVT